MVTLNEFLLILNAVSCGVTATCLGTFQRRGARHSYFGALLALILIVSCGAIVILIACGSYTQANPFETVINLVLCVSVVRARGNVMRIFKPQREFNENQR
ncbi:phage holin family protein [Enterobacter cloacae]|uniref:phage holin family protein n=1 Tax=Enterobacter cloacae TaxID=550 RepID=UPI0034A54A30|nr:phage holin family protein [Enterobacter cloacae]